MRSLGPKTISWDRDKLQTLREEYMKAFQERKLDFCIIFDEGPCEFVTAYARYLIEYLDTEFAKHPDIPAQPYNEGTEGQ